MIHITAWRIAVASREEHPNNPPPWNHRDWLRVNVPMLGDDPSAEARGRAVGKSFSRGYVFRMRIVALNEAHRWSRHWHTRIVVVRCRPR